MLLTLSRPCKKLHDIAKNSGLPIFVTPAVLTLRVSESDRSSRGEIKNPTGIGARV